MTYITVGSEITVQDANIKITAVEWKKNSMTFEDIETGKTYTRRLSVMERLFKHAGFAVKRTHDEWYQK